MYFAGCCPMGSKPPPPRSAKIPIEPEIDMQIDYSFTIPIFFKRKEAFILEQTPGLSW